MYGTVVSGESCRRYCSRIVHSRGPFWRPTAGELGGFWRCFFEARVFLHKKMKSWYRGATPGRARGMQPQQEDAELTGGLDRLV